MSRSEPKLTLLSLGTKNEARYSCLIKEIAMPEGTVSAVPTRILVPIDFSSSSHTALEVATELADKFHAELVLLNVVPESPVVALPEGVSEASIIEAAKKQAEGHLAKSKSTLEGKGITVKTSVQVGYDVAGTILETIETDKVDQVVISTHGISGWYPTVFGSIAEKVVKLAPCPVLLLRTPKPKSSTKVSSGRLMEWW
jgi:nucleotide-binding universal stress UspA family protein